MSGKPSPGKTSEIRKILKEKYELEKEYEILREQRDRASKRLKELDGIFAKQSSDILKALENMDVHSRGNYGWEERTLWFLTELVGSEEILSTENKVNT